MSERDRLDFVEKRDGRDGMLKFAEQTLAVYVVQSIKKGPYKDAIAELTEVLEEVGLTVFIADVRDNSNRSEP
jgi:uncharacterized protein (DUF302 family)